MREERHRCPVVPNTGPYHRRTIREALRIFVRGAYFRDDAIRRRPTGVCGDAQCVLLFAKSPNISAKFNVLSFADIKRFRDFRLSDISRNNFYFNWWRGLGCFREDSLRRCGLNDTRLERDGIRRCGDFCGRFRAGQRPILLRIYRPRLEHFVRLCEQLLFELRKRRARQRVECLRRHGDGVAKAPGIVDERYLQSFLLQCLIFQETPDSLL